MLQKRKKLFSVILALVMFIGVFANATVFADPAQNGAVEIVLSLQMDDAGFMIARQNTAIRPGLAKSYGYDNNPDIVAEDEVSALDAIVAAHIKVLGDDPDIIRANLEVGVGGFLMNFMGIGANCLYFVNGELAEIPSCDYALKSGDIVELFVIKDTVNYNDIYTWFEVDGKEVKTLAATISKPFELTLNSSLWGSPFGGVADAKIVPVILNADGSAGFGLPIAATDANGNATVTIDSDGVYILSAVGTGDTPLMSPWLTVTIGFRDVPASHWAKEYIDYLSAEGVMAGIGDNLFEPEREITRAEFVTILSKISGDELPADVTGFADVAAAAWYAPYVAWALRNGITSGTSETTFSPDMTITRQDMALMLAKYMSLKGIVPDYVNENALFNDDAEIAGYAKEAVYSMRRMGIISGMGGNIFAPLGKSVRAQAAAMIAGFLIALDE